MAAAVARTAALRVASAAASSRSAAGRSAAQRVLAASRRARPDEKATTAPRRVD